MGELAYDPLRIESLRRSTLAALDELSTLRSDDRLAADAMRVVRLTRQNLEEHWLSFLDQIGRSTALTAWTSTHAPGGADALVAALVTMLVRSPWASGVDRLAGTARVAIAARDVLGDPQACLDALADRAALGALVTLDGLPDELIEALLVAALRTAVVDDPSRLGDGYRVLRELIALANGTLDRGFPSGAARAVAASIGVYLPSLAPAIRHEGRAPVYVVDDVAGIEVDLGTYDDLVDLVGAVLRDRTAQVALGAALGEYTVALVDELGPQLTVMPTLAHATRFADLLADASRNEQFELDLAAATEEARRRQIGQMIAVGIDAALAATGASTASRRITDTTIDLATNALAHVEPDRLPDLGIPTATYDLITVTSVRMLVTRPSVRRQVGVGSVTAAQWREVRRRLGEIDAATDAAERRKATARLERWIETDVGALAGYLRDVQATSGMDELTEARPAVATD